MKHCFLTKPGIDFGGPLFDGLLLYDNNSRRKTQSILTRVILQFDKEYYVRNFFTVNHCYDA